MISILVEISCDVCGSTCRGTGTVTIVGGAPKVTANTPTGWQLKNGQMVCWRHTP